MTVDGLNWMQRYAASEMVEHAGAGRLSRRELLVRLVAICGSASAAGAFLAACGGDDDTPDSSSSAGADSTGSTVVIPPTTSGSGAVLSVAADDPAIEAESVSFAGPAGTVVGYYASPVDAGSRAGVLVIHELFGLNDHIRDVARRLAKAGHLALAVDLASRAGGTDAAANVAGALVAVPVEDLVADLDAGAAFLAEQPGYDGTLGVIGFCFGGGMTLSYAAAQPDVAAAVPYYGPTPQPASVMTATNAAILAQYGSDDLRVNAGIPDLEAALAGKTFETRMYDGAGHAFNNDTGAAYNEAAAVAAWTATLEWLAEHLG